MELPVFQVVSNGVTIEFTTRQTEATQAYAESQVDKRDKFIFELSPTGTKKQVYPAISAIQQ